MGLWAVLWVYQCSLTHTCSLTVQGWGLPCQHVFVLSVCVIGAYQPVVEVDCGVLLVAS